MEPAVIAGAPPVEVALAAADEAAEAADEAAEAADEAADEAPEASEEATELAPLEAEAAADEAADEAPDRAEDREPEAPDRAEDKEPEAPEAPGVLKTVEKPVVTGLPETVATRGTVVIAEGAAPPVVEALTSVAAELAADAALERIVRAEPPVTLAEARRALQ